MKKLLSLLVFAGLLLVVSCSDDDEVSLPTLEAPATATTGLGTEATATFTFTADAGYGSSSVQATGADAAITTEPTAGATSGDIVVTYTPTDLGSNTIIVTITDASGSSVDATLAVETNDFETVTVSANITSDVTWEASKVYQMTTRITVEAGSTLTIEAGTIIKSEQGTSSDAAALVVARDATIMAMGTAAAPIIFTSVTDDIVPGEIEGSIDPAVQGLWGGVIILGNAPISASADEVQIEGIPTSDTNGLYGGTDASDNSGTFQYVSIRHGGAEIAPGNEINGLSLGGVGSGTTISHVEVVGNKDDGIEFFGGNVDVSNVLVWNSGDDGLDTDQDWIGTCDTFIILTPTGGSAFELDGPEGPDARSFHTFNNGVVYAGNDIDHLVDFDGSTNAAITNVYFFGIPDALVATADFDPIESFGGDGQAPSSGWEATVSTNITIADVFGDAADVTSEVAENQNTVGPDATNFGWTLAGVSGALADIGL